MHYQRKIFSKIIMIQAKKKICVFQVKKNWLVGQELFRFYFSFFFLIKFWKKMTETVYSTYWFICTIYKAVSFYSSRKVLNSPSLINLFVFCTIIRLNLTCSIRKKNLWGVHIKSNFLDILQQFLVGFGSG